MFTSDSKKTTRWILVLLKLFLFLYPVLGFSNDIVFDSGKNVLLQGGDYALDPYQYQKEDNGIKVLTGMDIELMRAIAKEANVKVNFEHMTWEELLLAVEQGTKDFALGALYSPERAQIYYFSQPYRYEETSLFVNKTKHKLTNFKTTQEFLSEMQQKKFRLGVVRGYLYTDPVINAYIQNPLNEALVVKTNNDYENVEALLRNEIDGFLADRIVGATIAWRMQAQKIVTEKRLSARRSVHIIFSKKTVPDTLVHKFNEVIDNMKNKEVYQRIVSWYLYPILFLQIEDTVWFIWTEIIGIMAFAISGLIIAFKEKSTLFGAFILAILPSLGGGLMRDVIIGRNPVGAMQSPLYLSTVIITVIGGFFLVKFLIYLKQQYEISGEIEELVRTHAGIILVVTDSLGLAMFTVTGVIVCLLVRIEPIWLWGPFFAFLTGAGGGILRDMLSKSRYIAALEGELYGEVAIFWGFILSLFIVISEKIFEPEYLQYAVIITILGAFVTRLMVHFYYLPNARFGSDILKK